MSCEQATDPDKCHADRADARERRWHVLVQRAARITRRMLVIRPQPSRFDYIDALRGYAIALVMIAHCTFLFNDVPKSVATSFLGYGGRGVQLFFIASAITLMMSWKRHHDGAGPFYVRRIFRIAPMWYSGDGLLAARNGHRATIFRADRTERLGYHPECDVSPYLVPHRAQWRCPRRLVDRRRDDVLPAVSVHRRTTRRTLAGLLPAFYCCWPCAPY